MPQVYPVRSGTTNLQQNQKKARVGMDPRTGEKIKVKAGKTVRFKASPVLRRTVTASRQRRSDSEPAPRSRRRDTREVSAEQLSAAAD